MPGHKKPLLGGTLRRRWPALLAGAALMTVSAWGVAQPDPQQMKKLQKLMGQQIQLMSPEMQKKVKALSPQSKKAMLMIYAQHDRRSDSLTLRQVMHEVLADYQSTASGIFTENTEQAADSARRLANHRLPRAGILPYMTLEQVNDDSVGALVAFNNAVEGKALQLAEVADNGDLNAAAELLGEIANGCVGCHQMFRGKPGISPHVKQPE